MPTPFKLVTNLAPAGDQPKAIDELVAGLKRGDPAQVLLGITGSGKTFTMAHVIAQVQRPTLVMAHNKTLAHQLFGEFKTTHSQSFTIQKDDTERYGIYVSAPNGKLQFATSRSFTDPVHDLKKTQKAPKGCTVYNLDINYDTWMTLT